MLVLAPLVVVAAAVAWAAGFRRGAIVGGGAVIGLLLLGTIVQVAFGVREEVADDPAGEDREAAPAPDLEPTDVEPRVRRVDVVLVPPADPFVVPAPRAALQGLEDGDVRMVEIAVEGTVTLHQCRAGTVTADRCAPGVTAVAIDRPPGGLVELRTEIATPGGPVDCLEAACVLAVFEGPELLFDLPLTFAGSARSEPEVTVDPATGVQAGEDVVVTVGGLAPDASGHVAFCTAAEGAATATCRDEAAVALSRVGPSGDATATLPLSGCPRTDRCAVRAAVDGFPLTYARVAFASPPGPDLGGGQLAGGLVAAAGLFLAAMVVLRRTDWTNPDGDPFTGIDVSHDDPFAGVDLDVDEWGAPWA